MKTRITIASLEYDLSNKEPLTFRESKSLCVNGWRIAKIKELIELADKIDSEQFSLLNGNDKKPNLYWTPGMADNPFGDGNIDESSELVMLFDFDCRWGNSLCPKEEKYKMYLILVREKDLEVIIDGKEVDINNSTIDGVDTKEGADDGACDAHFSEAFFIDGEKLNDDQLDKLNDNHRELAIEYAIENFHDF